MFGRCPGEVIINFDTARLIRRGSPRPVIVLSCRCAVCDSRSRITYILKKSGIECEGEHENAVCQHHGCNETSFYGSPRCANHITEYVQMCETAKTAVSIRPLRETFNRMAHRQWQYPPHYEIVGRRISEIAAGKRPGSSLVVLDDEWSPATRELWQFAIIEQVSGRILINTSVEHEDSVDRNPLFEDTIQKRISQKKEQALFGPSRKGKIGYMNVHEISCSLRKAQINEDTIFLVYHTGYFDLTLLRELLQTAGYYGILPPNKNCIPMINVIRPNFSKEKVQGKAFPLKLGILFPTMFPSHPLVGLNHQALEDCQQTRLVCQAFDELCKPIKERKAEWHPADVASLPQKPITDWFQLNGNGEFIFLVPTDPRLIKCTEDRRQELVSNGGEDLPIKQVRSEKEVEFARCQDMEE